MEKHKVWLNVGPYRHRGIIEVPDGSAEEKEVRDAALKWMWSMIDLQTKKIPADATGKGGE
jgi:hypothetical protein